MRGLEIVRGPAASGALVTALIAVAVVGLPACVSAETIVVDYDGIASPHTRIQQGLDAAQDGDEVWVISSLSMAPVTFRGPGNRDLDFGGNNIALLAPEGPLQTIIDGDNAYRAMNLSAGTDSTSLVSGFTIQNCYSDGEGGAILCQGGAPRIEGCVFRGNVAAYGGAIKLSQGPTRITACTFYANDASERGGAVHASDSDLTLRNCTLSDNTAHKGGGLAAVDSNVTAWRCTFANNEGVFGSSVWLESATALIEQCIMAFGRRGSCLWGDETETFHCCVFGNDNGDALPGNAHDNLFEDPLICELYEASGGNMSLCSNSQCLAGNNPWGLPVGSKEQGCPDCVSPVESTTWGGIKSLYR